MTIAGGKRAGHAYLRLQVAPQCEAVVGMEYAQEAIVIPAIRLTVIPNTNPYLIGVLNHRNRVFWLVDLPHLLGFPQLSTSLPEYAVALLRIEGSPLAFAVSQVKGVLRADRESLRSPLELDVPSLVPYLQGCLSSGEHTILVLDPPAIARSVGEV